MNWYIVQHIFWLLYILFLFDMRFRISFALFAQFLIRWFSTEMCAYNIPHFNICHRFKFIIQAAENSLKMCILIKYYAMCWKKKWVYSSVESWNMALLDHRLKQLAFSEQRNQTWKGWKNFKLDSFIFIYMAWLKTIFQMLSAFVSDNRRFGFEIYLCNVMCL